MIQLENPTLLREESYINGEWVTVQDKIHITNPATADPIASVPDLSAEQTRNAINNAQKAFEAYSQYTAQERAQLLQTWYRLIIENKEDLAKIMTAEMGKPIAESRAEVAYGASFCAFFAEEARRIYGEIIPTHKKEARILTIRQPIGVCAAITPWNFPLAMITRKIAPALAAGCTVVCKPATETPLTALALAKLAHEAGFPKGVINVITGNEVEIGKELTQNPIVRALSFTGSTEVGRLLMAQSAQTLKKLSFELGGNAPFIVFDDANLEAAVEGAIICKFRNAGQTCVCANRIYVQDGIHDAFLDALRKRIETFKVGDGNDPHVSIGPLINQNAIEKVVRHIHDAREKGAQCIIGGEKHERGGLFFQPTILTHMTHDMAIAHEETFGPVAPIFRFTHEEDAVKNANDTEFGLAAYFYSQNLGRCWRVGEALEYGIIGINEGIISTEIAPFGGVKQSGLGREGSHHAIEEYTEIKYMLMGGLNR